MPGLSFLAKKKWHTSNIKNVEKVWVAEQKDEQERKRLAEFQKQLLEERQIHELRQLQAAQGQVVKHTDNSLDWMYEGPGGGTQVQKDSEEYLLGKIYKPRENNNTFEVGGASAIVQQGASSSSGGWVSKVSNKNDIFSRKHEDPMIAIKQAEKAQRDKIVNNPLQMERIRQSVAKHLEETEFDEDRKQRARKELHSKSQRECSNSDGSESDDSRNDERKRKKHSKKKHKKDKKRSREERHRDDSDTDNDNRRVSESDKNQSEKQGRSSRDRDQKHRSPSSSRQLESHADHLTDENKRFKEDHNSYISNKEDQQSHRHREEDRHSNVEYPRSNRYSRDSRSRDDRKRGHSRDRYRDNSRSRRHERDDRRSHRDRDYDRDSRRHGENSDSRPERERSRSRDSRNRTHENSSSTSQKANHNRQVVQEEGTTAKQDVSSKKSWGLVFKGRQTGVDEAANSALDRSSAGIGPSAELLKKKEEERLQGEKVRQENLRRARGAGRSNVTEEERFARLKAMTQDAQVIDSSRVLRNQVEGSVNDATQIQSQAGKAAVFIHDMRSEVLRNAGEATGIKERIDTHRHYMQRSSALDDSNASSFLSR